MTHASTNGQILLFPETDEDRRAILAILGPPADEPHPCSYADAARVYRELVAILRARPTGMTETQPVQPRARGIRRIFQKDGTVIEADTGPEVDQK